MITGILATLAFFYIVSVVFVARELFTSKPWRIVGHNMSAWQWKNMTGIALNLLLAPAVIAMWIKDGK